MRYFWILFFFLFLLVTCNAQTTIVVPFYISGTPPAPPSGAIDTVVSASVEAGTVPISVPITIPEGHSSLCMTISIQGRMWYNTDHNDTVTTVYWNTTEECTRQYRNGIYTGNQFDDFEYTLVNPTTGTHNVTINACHNIWVTVEVIVWENVNQTTPTIGYVSATGYGTTASCIITDAVSTDITVDATFIGNDNGASITTGDGQTLVVAQERTSETFPHSGRNSYETGAGSHTHSHTWAAAEDWIVVVYRLQKAP